MNIVDPIRDKDDIKAMKEYLKETICCFYSGLIQACVSEIS